MLVKSREITFSRPGPRTAGVWRTTAALRPAPLPPAHRPILEPGRLQTSPRPQEIASAPGPPVPGLSGPVVIGIPLPSALCNITERWPSLGHSI